MLLDGSNGVLEEDLGGERVPMVYYWLTTITIPTVHCECVCVGGGGGGGGEGGGRGVCWYITCLYMYPAYHRLL